METLTQPTLLLKPFAENGDRNSIPVTNTDASNPQRADLTNGFPEITSEDPEDIGLPPERADVNGLGYLTTTYDYFYQAGGTFTYNATVANAIGGYPLNARLWYTDVFGRTTILKSTKANNTDNFLTNPSSIGTSWVPEIPTLGGDNNWSGSNNFSWNCTFSGIVDLCANAVAYTQDINDNDTSVATTAFTYNLENAQKTNCFLKIPQDINLELNNGTLTLKAGSKVYVPNGSGTFNTVTISSDISSNSSWTTSDVMIARSENGSALYAYKLDNHYSGSSAPSSPIEGTIWYDTTNNLIKRYNGSSWSNGGVSFPICIASMVSGTGLVSIKKVFNGLGYIGNVLFALPGSTALIPNGRYSNGMPRNSVLNLSSVRTLDIPTATSVGSRKIVLYGSGFGVYDTFIYDQTTNKNYVSQNISSENAREGLLVGSVYFDSSNGKVVGIDTTDTFNGASRYDVKNIQSEYLSNIAQGNYKEFATLYDGSPSGATSGNITLSRPYTDFDALLILGTGDTYNLDSCTNILTTDEIKRRIAQSQTVSGSIGRWVLYDGGSGEVWTCRSDSTDTSFLEGSQNCRIISIYGINF